MSDIAVQARGLSKLYHLDQRARHGTLRDLLAEGMSAPFRRRHTSASEKNRHLDHNSNRSSDDGQLWALKDVSFQVEHGKILGIIGSNGAGKSTLLKVLSRITQPTDGRVDIHGRLGSLLEVGTGFRPELTGRENVYLNGAILGIKRSEIKRRFDDIVEFSEIEKYIDTPVKRYSSGMYARLAFAVAAHLEPDILVVDEVLAVGDASFQSKCLGKMGNAARHGRTVLFVSHNMLAVEDLCDRVIWLENGRIVEEGEPATVISKYLQSSISTDTEQVWQDRTKAPGTADVSLHRVCVRPVNGSPVDPITVRTPFVVEVEYWSLRPNTYLSPVLIMYNEQGIALFTSSPGFDPEGHKRKHAAGLYRYVCRVPRDLLNDGVHRIRLHINKNGKVIMQEDDILTFDVRDDIESRHGWHGKWNGAIRPLLNWSTELVESES